MGRNKVVILDCYTDEPSGFGVRPYLGTHQLHLSQALSFLGIAHDYLTIDDLRYGQRGTLGDQSNTDLSTINITRNCDRAIEIIQSADIIYIVMGCFVDYSYFSTVPPKSDEVYSFLQNVKARKVLFYVLGTVDGISPDYKKSMLSTIIDYVEFGNAYRFVLEPFNNDSRSDLLEPNYQLLDIISSCEPQIINQLRYPIIAEIETGTGCHVPYCYFCIESLRSPKVTYRNPESIIKQVKCLYDFGIRHFRLGRQPNFYHYQFQDVEKVKSLLIGIREKCPDIKTLHIDNANIVSVISKNGVDITKLIVEYCTSGNIAPLGIESFDNTVRKAIHKVGTADQALKAISIISNYGHFKDLSGLSKFLPGINLIYGLPSQSPLTHQINLEYLSRILQNGWYASRLFFRKMTRPTGISFTNGPAESDEHLNWFKEIIDLFVLPMQERVFPKGTIINGQMEVVVKNSDSYTRTLGTCPIRVIIKGKILEPYEFQSVRIINNLDYRLLEGELVNRVA